MAAPAVSLSRLASMEAVAGRCLVSMDFKTRDINMTASVKGIWVDLACYLYFQIRSLPSALTALERVLSKLVFSLMAR